MGAAQSTGIIVPEDEETNNTDNINEDIENFDELNHILKDIHKDENSENEEEGPSSSHVNEHTQEDDDEEVEEETREERLKRKREEMEEFYNNILSRREQRNKAINEISRKMKKVTKLEEELEKEREEKQTLDLHCKALKEVNKITKEMLRIREGQITELKTRLKDVEKKLLESPEEIKLEYEKQMTNYKKLRELYEQRQIASELEHKTMIEKELAKNALLEAKLKDIQDEIKSQLEKYQNNKIKITEMENNIHLKDDEINTLNENLTSSIAENHILSSQMNIVNNLFSNMLINPMINLDFLIKLLQDNSSLILDLVNNHEINDTVSLLVDIEKKIDQETEGTNNSSGLKQIENASENVETKNNNNDIVDEGATTSNETSNMSEVDEDSERKEEKPFDKTQIQKEIANNLPKVWRILIELLNTHQEKYENNDINERFDSCYKNVQTPSGKTQQVISVSQTFIRLKHLILEKNHLNNQLIKLKTLNNHLEGRLNDSEQRLNTVKIELHKTWSVVNKLKLQHKQLYTHEKILKYELKHKRNIINDLKIDLEYVREKWDLVKEKNEQNEIDYKILRKEFALRRLQYDGGNSTSESGISTDEDDNVEIVETNDETDDEKSEIVETQSEHDVVHTNSVMSIEEDDDHADGVEELETEVTHTHSDVNLSNNVTDETPIEDVQTNLENNMNVELEVNENILDRPETENRTSTESQSNENHSIERNTESNSSNTQVFGENQFTVKTIGGNIKIVTEHKPSSSNTNLDQSDDPTQIDTSTNSLEKSSTQLKRQDCLSTEMLENHSEVPSTTNIDASQNSDAIVENKNTCYETNLDSTEEPIVHKEINIQSSEPSASNNITLNDTNRDESLSTDTNFESNKSNEDKINELNLSEASTSRTKTPEERLEARNARLKRLEDQTKNLFHKMSLTSQRSDTISERLVELHDYYGNSNERHSPRRGRGESGSEDRESTSPEQSCSSPVQKTQTLFENNSSSAEQHPDPRDPSSIDDSTYQNETTERYITSQEQNSSPVTVTNSTISEQNNVISENQRNPPTGEDTLGATSSTLPEEN